MEAKGEKQRSLQLQQSSEPRRNSACAKDGHPWGTRGLTHPLLDFTARGLGRVVLVTVMGTLGCVAAALYVDSFNFPGMAPERLRQALLINILLPTALAGPALLVFSIKLRELAIAHAELTILATTDGLTSVLNRRAFKMLVEGYLQRVDAQQRPPRGAFLIVDADHFKAINDDLGHDQGDEALQIIAQSIKGQLRGADIVGRIGGEEFGVFLPGSSEKEAESVAERIRSTITEVDFSPAGKRRPLTVSVGGVSFERPLGFNDLFKAADRHLYEAKQNGRNRRSVAPAGAFAQAA